jgi:formylglycine-generating enzyme required for sulfatase activity
MAEPGEETGSTRRESGRRTRGRPVDLDRLFDVLQPEAAGGPKSLTNSAGLSFVLIPAGTFQMGSPDTEPGHRTNEAPVHEIVIGKPLFMGIQPVTQAQYLTVMGKNPARFTPANGGSPQHPVEMVSWDDAAAFCRQLSERPEERAAGHSYRLPTEAEWEYACRAGTATAFGHGATFLAGQGNFDAAYPCGDASPGVALGHTTPVTRFPASAWGLNDMHGNVWEWCSDWYAEGYYRSSPLRDPVGPPEGKLKVLRGGSWRNHGSACRAAYRNALAPHQKDSATGFRVMLVLAERGT